MILSKLNRCGKHWHASRRWKVLLIRRIQTKWHEELLLLMLETGFGVPRWTGELVVSGIFQRSLYENKVLLFLPQRSGSRSAHETPLFPPRVCGFPRPALCCSVFRFNPCHPLVECEGECAVCAHVCLSARIYMNVCVLCAGSTVVHICVLRQCGALWFPAPTNLDFLLPPLIRLIIFPPPVPAAALILLYRPCFVYSIEDVWLNILRPVESSWFSNFTCPVCQKKNRALC